ncbi:MAG: hypothetical protein ABW208_08005, partial [Pyrinomonadaceae bacterium]
MKEFLPTSSAAGLAAELPAAVADVAAPDLVPDGAATPEPGPPLTPEDVRRYMRLYAANPLFGYLKDWVITDNPYRRPVDQQTVPRHDFSRPLKREESLNASALSAQRMLFNVYETDLVFLPEKDFAAKRGDFASFYSNENKLLGELIRPTLETHLFSFLDKEIDVSGKWSGDAVKSYLQSVVESHERSELASLQLILSSPDPERAAAALMIQVAGDFLTESSSSARNLLGKFGTVQSELFKIAIDDYGY